MVKFEVCINCDGEQSVTESVGYAYSGGASTVELCGAMHLDGLTPTKDQIIEARKAFKDRSGLMIMIRPRSGDFFYSKQELDLMCQQIEAAADSGADGVVFGILNQHDISVHREDLSYLIAECLKRQLTVTFHRAFDAIPNKLDALEVLIDLGVNRVLTSGTLWGKNNKALDGIETLKRIIEVSGNRIEVVIGGGINVENISEILKSLPTEKNNISVHSYSGVLKEGNVDPEKIVSLVKLAKEF